MYPNSFIPHEGCVGYYRELLAAILKPECYNDKTAVCDFTLLSIGGHGYSKLTVATLVLLLVVGVCAVVYAISTSHNHGVHRSEYESESTKASRKKAEVKSPMDAQIKGSEFIIHT